MNQYDLFILRNAQIAVIDQKKAMQQGFSSKPPLEFRNGVRRSYGHRETVQHSVALVANLSRNARTNNERDAHHQRLLNDGRCRFSAWGKPPTTPWVSQLEDHRFSLNRPPKSMPSPSSRRLSFYEYYLGYLNAVGSSFQLQTKTSWMCRF